MLRELHHHVHRVQRIPHHHLAHVHHVRVVHGEQDVRLAERGHGETLAFLLHLHLLQRAHFAAPSYRARNTTPYVPSSMRLSCSNANTDRHPAIDVERTSTTVASSSSSDEGSELGELGEAAASERIAGSRWGRRDGETSSRGIGVPGGYRPRGYLLRGYLLRDTSPGIRLLLNRRRRSRPRGRPGRPGRRRFARRVPPSGAARGGGRVASAAFVSVSRFLGVASPSVLGVRMAMIFATFQTVERETGGPTPARVSVDGRRGSPT